MTTRKNQATGLTLRKAWEELVDPELRNELQEKHDERIAFEKRAVAEFGRPVRGHILLGKDEQRHRRYHPMKSKEYQSLKKAEAAAKAAAMEQFYSKLAQCCVMGRQGFPTASSAVIPNSALPALRRNHRTRLRIVSYDESRMAFGFREREITYFDIEVWLPDGMGQSLDPPIRSVPNAVLDRFLTGRGSSREVGDPELTADALWEAAKAAFPDHKVTRRRVRDWVDTHMPQSKRFKRGQKPKKTSSGT